MDDQISSLIHSIQFELKKSLENMFCNGPTSQLMAHNLRQWATQLLEEMADTEAYLVKVGHVTFKGSEAIISFGNLYTALLAHGIKINPLEAQLSTYTDGDGNEYSLGRDGGLEVVFPRTLEMINITMELSK